MKRRPLTELEQRAEREVRMVFYGLGLIGLVVLVATLIVLWFK